MSEAHGVRPYFPVFRPRATCIWMVDGTGMIEIQRKRCVHTTLAGGERGAGEADEEEPSGSTENCDRIKDNLNAARQNDSS